MGKPKAKKAAAIVARKRTTKLKADGGEPRNNPFEVRVNRKKHDVLGQKIKSGRGLPGVARSRAIQKRKKTLLVEYHSRHKTSKFVDQRFGENSENMSVEEKAMRRFLLEKKKRHGRSGLFNLEDGEGEGNEDWLTHFGQSLGDMEKFDEVQLSEGEEEEEDVGETHFGGFLKKKKKTQHQDQEEEEKPKSRKEIMNEVVAKSKLMKHERQTERQNVEELRDSLDTQWRDVRELVTQPKPTAPSTDRASVSAAAADYDRVVKELLYERRAQATDRLKTEEELAKEERERLQNLEADRVRRMKGVLHTLEDAAQAEEGLEHASADTITSKSKAKKDVRFLLHYKDGVMVVPARADSDTVEKEAEAVEESGEEESEEEGSGEEGGEDMSGAEEAEGEDDVEEGESDGDPAEEFGSDLESEEDSEQEEEEDDFEEEEGGEGDMEHSGVSDKEEKKKLTDMRRAAAKELPYTFEVPQSLQELLAIVEDRSPDDCVTVVERVHSCNHPSLSPDNKRQLEKFFTILVSYCCHLGMECTPDSLATLNKMASPVFSLAHLDSLHTARVFRKHLQSVHKTWKANKTRRFPPVEHVVLFKLVCVIFPTSDFKHPITTPAMLLMGQMLLKSSVATAHDLVLGLLICEILTEFIGLSKRFVPELVNFLTSCTALFSTHSHGAVLYPPFTSSSRLGTDLCESIGKWPPTHSPPPSLLCLATRHESAEEDATIAAGILSCCLGLVSKLCQLYKDLPSFPELFSGISFNLQSVPDLCPAHQELRGHVLEVMSTVSAAPRPVLQLLKRKPKSIKFYEPSYNEMYDVSKRRAVSKTANEKQKLRYKVKREKKGAIRELRKDSHFLSREKLKESRERDAEREKKTRQILHDLQSMQHEEKMERLKRKR